MPRTQIKSVVPVSALTSTTLFICGGSGDHDSLHLLNLSTSDFLMSSLTPVDHSFAPQYRESGAALWSMVLDQALVATEPQPWVSSKIFVFGGSIGGKAVNDITKEFSPRRRPSGPSKFPHRDMHPCCAPTLGTGCLTREYSADRRRTYVGETYEYSRVI